MIVRSGQQVPPTRRRHHLRRSRCPAAGVRRVADGDAVVVAVPELDRQKWTTGPIRGTHFPLAAIMTSGDGSGAVADAAVVVIEP
jgi:Neuraminidase (sialidase)